MCNKICLWLTETYKFLYPLVTMMKNTVLRTSFLFIFIQKPYMSLSDVWWKKYVFNNFRALFIAHAVRWSKYAIWLPDPFYFKDFYLSINIVIGLFSLIWKPEINQMVGNYMVKTYESSFSPSPNKDRKTVNFDNLDNRTTCWACIISTLKVML